MSDKTSASQRFDSIDSQLDKIVGTIVKGFDRIDKQLEQKPDSSEIQKILDALDAISKRQEINDDERLVMGHQLERLNRWTQELADKIGYKLTT